MRSFGYPVPAAIGAALDVAKVHAAIAANDGATEINLDGVSLRCVRDAETAEIIAWRVVVDAESDPGAAMAALDWPAMEIEASQ